MPDVIITPNSGLIEFRPSSTTVNKIEASGNTFNLVNTANPSGTIFNIEATNGSLFSVVDNLSGTLMSVNNNAGLPVLEVFSDDRIIGGRFGYNDFVVSSSGNVGIGTASPSGKLGVIGEIIVDNLKLDGNTLSITNTNGSLILNPNNVGSVFIGESLGIEFNPSSYQSRAYDSGPEIIYDFNPTYCTFNKGSGGGLGYALYIDRNSQTSTVGINTNTPSQALHVAGNILCDQLYLEKTSAPAISSNTLTINLANSQLFLVSLNSNITTLTISNTPATSNITVGFTIIFTADGTARSVTWPASVKWAGGVAPTLTSTNAKKDVLSFVSTDNGTTWLGFVGGQNY